MNRSHVFPRLVPLSELGPSQVGQAGGKATHLGQLLRAGFTVPPGFVLLSSAFDRFLEHTGLWSKLEVELRTLSPIAAERAEQLSSLRARMRGATLPPELQEALRQAWERLVGKSSGGAGVSPVAVRSSGKSEDSAQASFAGQYDTVLNVRDFDTLCSAVREVWSSYLSERAVGYRETQGKTFGEHGLAVLVQVMIEPEVSGTLFTVNPLTGQHREMLLEAGYGLGEAFASGRLCPDTYYLSRPRFSWQPDRIAVTGQSLADKTHRLVSNPSGGLCLEPVPAPQRSAAALDSAQLHRLGRLGLKLERLFRAPQDIEWTIDRSGTIFILQARPITTGSSHAYRRRDTVIWTRRFAGERWTEPATPLGWSLISPVLDHFIYFDEVARRYLHGSRPTRIVDGYPYFNLTIFRHLVWKVLGMAPPQFILEFFPAEEQEAMLRAPSIVPNLALVRDIFADVLRTRRWRRYHFNFLTNHSAWTEFLPTLLRAIEGLSEPARSPEEARAQLEIGVQWVGAYVRIHLLSLLFANLYYQLLTGLVQRWARLPGETGADALRGSSELAQLLSDLVAWPGENKTVETNRALMHLALQARAHQALRECLEQEGAPPSPDTLRSLPGGSTFLENLEIFLQQYGHRAGASWEIFVPRWVDQPARVIQMVATLLRTQPCLDLEQAEAQRTLARQQAEDRVLEAVGHLHPGRKAVLKAVLRETQAYMILRENQRFYFDLLLLRLKRSAEALGRMWVEKGILEHPEELTLLNLEELDQCLAGKLRGTSMRTLLAQRRRELASARKARPPVFLEGDTLLTPLQTVPGRTLTGLGISPGRVTGVARVLEHWSEMERLHRGDILVTRATDPGWTFLFLTAGGLVTELGSLLSHGAVVAREYNLPAVVNVSEATSRLRDGQRITVDGFRGVVYVHEGDVPEVDPPGSSQATRSP